MTNLCYFKTSLVTFVQRITLKSMFWKKAYKSVARVPFSGRLTRTRIVARLVVPPVSQRAHGADYAPKHYSDLVCMSVVYLSCISRFNATIP